ncbi:hypothetical protein EBB07_31340 [Paenibacillaceae bacterium]|nr:hypothetical protein EBB07_31340 [Paenibacillaceae bacterium]
MEKNTKPICSFIGLGLFIITLAVHLCFRLSRTSDVGIAMLLSLANSLLLIFTLLWSVMGIIEFRTILKAHKKIKYKLNSGEIYKVEYKKKAKKYKAYLTINVIYLAIILCQLGYVIYNWDEVNV